jgi:cation diffusion facilitator family transporter
MSLIAAADARSHSHRFDDGNPLAERNTRRALWLTAVMMVVEIVGGWWFNSMAVLADGWHMSSHALALGLAVFAYACARRYAHDGRFAFGTWKIEILGGYTSAIALLGVALLMAVQSAQRLFSPSAIHYDQAIAIAVVGLGVNLLCAWWLHDSHGHDHGHHHGHGHGHAHGHHRDPHAAQPHQHGPHPDAHDDHGHPHIAQDLNLRSAYLHVVADAATSVLAIAALVGGKFWGAAWLDPVMGLVGAVLVTVWAVGLLRDTGRILLDAQMDAPVVAEVREVIEQGPWAARLADLHVWQVGRGKYAVVASVVTDAEVSADTLRDALSIHEELVHITVEVNPIAPPLSYAAARTQ